MLVMRLMGKPPCFCHHPITISVSASSSLNKTQACQSSPGRSSYLQPYIAAGSVEMHRQGGTIPTYQDQMHSGEGFLGSERVSERESEQESEQASERARARERERE